MCQVEGNWQWGITIGIEINKFKHTADYDMDDRGFEPATPVTGCQCFEHYAGKVGPSSELNPN